MRLAFVVALLSCACERKAPGPAECQAFALHVAGINSRDDLESPRDREKLDNLTRECLVTPYDRELLRCVEVTSQFRLCQVEYRRRHPQR